MGVYILTEPIVRSRLWATRYAAGIREEAALGKHTMIEVAEPDYRGLAGKTVIVNAVTKTFCARVLPQLEAAEIRPLLLAPGKFSVRVDFESIYTGLLDELHRRGCRRTAFFGVNPDSLNDALKTDIFLAHGGREKDIYRNYGDLERCFDTYLQSLKHCDSVLFPNNVTASVFFRFCEERETDTHGLRFGTLGEVHCRTNEVIWSQFDCEEVGRQAVRCARFLDKCKEPAQFLFTVPGHIYGANLTRNPQPDDRPTVPVDYYGDQAVAEAIRYEQFCMVCDQIDREIVRGISHGCTYKKIAATLFMSEQNVKYRIKRLLKLSDYDSVDQFKADYRLYNGHHLQQAEPSQTHRSD